MSHFAVLLIGPKTTGEIDEALHPYWELDLKPEDAAEDERSEINLTIKEEEKDKKVAKILNDVKEMMDNYHEKEDEENEERYSNLFEKYNEYVVNKDYDAIFRDWDGYYPLADGSGWGYHHNPNAKWDWYQVGGRWTGYFKLKDGANGNLGTHLIFTDPAEPNTADQAKFGDIDWDAMVADEGYNFGRFWEIAVEGQTPTAEEKDKYLSFYKPTYYIERYGTKENYIDCKRRFSAWAVIDDGKWYEKGEMGWWGMSSESHEDAVQWEKGFWDRFMANLDPETMLTIVDCHI